MFNFIKKLLRLSNDISDIIHNLQKIKMKLIYPTAFSVSKIFQENNMANYSVSAGPVVDADVVERRVSVSVNGVVTSKSYVSETTVFDAVSVSDNENVVLTLVDVDKSGNVSEPAVVVLSGKDTVAPSKPVDFVTAEVVAE